MSKTREHEPWRFAEDLVEVARTDTAFADLFLQRARELLTPELSEAQFERLADIDTDVADLTNRIANAMDADDWRLVGELTAKVADAKRSASERAPVRELAARVYGFDEILVDPFSPGLSGLAGVVEGDLPARRDAATKRLDRLRAADREWADLYGARRAALAALRLGALDAAPGDAAPAAEALRARARQALADGNLTQLQDLAAKMMDLDERAPGAGVRAEASRWTESANDLFLGFARDVCDRAGKLGLAAHRVESTAEKVRTRYRPSWRPTVGRQGGTTVHLSVSIPGDTPDALRTTLELLMNRPFVTSAGTRYMPWFVGEDLLVEDFADPSPGEGATSSLISALGLPGRWGLGRRTIERAVRERGAAVVKELGLDPRTYRVVCVPVDVYTRLGAKLGWGKQPFWTHFDGYMASKERKLMALVGGDVRFGGLHDLVAVGADYDSDRLMARFAIVQRRRFATG